MRLSEWEKLKKLLDMKKSKREILEEMKPKKNGNSQQIPEGGITMRAAGRKYHIDNSTIWHWVKRGYIPVLLRTKKQVFIDERKAAELAAYHHKHGGKGKWSISKKIEAST